ncbi:FAD-binding protein [Candidatus Aerophobetes bacterium]|uniref:FAD-binding protein n=1 Tax=Aerophobetes bacterium TaxID=2030807 RepID=A0A523RY22_UNCAE|nr:MAG: FAD-binding protein [Candidatus Aerophobetes bacterium]
MQEYNCDVLIVGGGGAALRAALEIVEREPEARVILATKGGLGKSGVTANACSDRMAFHATLPFTEPQDKGNWKYHANDIYRIGGYVSDEDLAQILAKSSREAFRYLDSLGVPWVKKEGKPDQFLTDGSKYARACYTGPYTANHIEQALVRKIKSNRVKVLEDFMAVDLILSPSKNRVIGAFGLNRKEEIVLLKARTTILATGGAGEAFKINVYPEGMTGDGYAMACRAGVKLVNMEFIQIGLSSVKTKLACSGSIMRAIPRFINDRGEEFLPKYFPSNIPLSEVCLTIFQKGSSWPVSFEHKSHLIDIAVYKELRKGRKVYLDYICNPQSLKWEKLSEVAGWYEKVKGVHLLKEKRLKESPLLRLQRINPQAVSWLVERGVDLIRGDRIEIAPAAQHFQGGVKIREKAQTSIKGLYAAGECGGGQHGANRPGGNALLDCQVFGKIAGLSALEEAKSIKVSCNIGPVYIDKIQDNLRNLQNKSRGKEASLVRTRIQDLLFRYASVVRTEEGLSEAIKELREIEKRGIHADSKGLIFALETLDLLTVAQMVMGAARMRKESRGPHLYFHSFNDSEPLPRDDKLWQKYIIVARKAAGNIQLEIKKPAVI